MKNTLTFLALASIATAQDSSPIIVTGSSPDTVDSFELALEQISDTPGGASVISAEQSATGNAYNTKEILAFTPGVYARETSVPLDTRLSVRGGGATRSFGSRGITLLIDGIPSNISDGSFFTRGYDGSNIDYIEVFRGANGLARGGQSLGGSINFAQKNGRTAEGLTAFVEAGSFNLFRTGLSYGVNEGPVDAFINLSFGEADGFRDFQGWQQEFINANVGYEWNDNASTRVFFSYVNSDVELASGLSFAEFEDDPTQTTSTATTEDRDVEIVRIAQKTSFNSGNTESLFYTFFQYTDFDHLTTVSTFQGLPNLIRYTSNDFGLGYRSTTKFDQFTLRTDNALTYGILDNTGINGFAFPGGQEDTEDTFFNLKLYGELEYAISDKLQVFAGLGLVHAERQREVGSNDVTANIDFDEDYTEFLPRVGVLYQLNEEVSLYANYSRNFEAPASLEASVAAPNTAIPAVSDSFEIGSRFSNNKIQGEISAFYSIVNDEFTNSAVQPDGITPNLNTDAVYSGVELAGSVNLFGEGFGYSGLFLDLNYIYSNYFFTNGSDNGVDLDGNRIPGLPEHALNVRLKYQHEDGHELALTMETASGLFFNFENTVSEDSPESPSYAIFHLTGKYQINDQLNIYGGIRNLFDQDFINSVTVEGSEFPVFEGFSPGDGINYFVGLKYQF